MYLCRLAALVRLLWGRRGRDVAMAAIAGTGMAVLSWAMMTRRFPDSISPFFLDRALTEGGGTNVVNVMLVDFRGFDTFGEITVLGVVALTVYALLRRFRPALESMALPAQQRAQADDGSSDLLNPRRAVDTAVGYLMVPAVLVRLLLPLSARASVYFFMRGHNSPGGGFVGGLVMATAFIVQYMMSGTLWIEARMRVHPQYSIAAGLLCAAVAGMAAWPASRNFLSNIQFHGTLPLIGEVHLSTTILFDLGVYLLVVGATTLLLIAMAHQSLRSRRQQVETSTTRVLPADPAGESA
jgi:multicomponent K+:H+ antiporter subunit A